MNYLLIGSAAVVGAMVLYQVYLRTDLRRLARYTRWLAGGALAVMTAFLLLRGQVALATLTGPAAFMILRYGRIGRFSFEGTSPAAGNTSSVRSRYITMTLDHDTGTVHGRAVAGRFAGTDLMALGEAEMRSLLAETAADPDSLALLETWLDRNRAGWREYFAEQDADGGGDGSGEGRAVDPTTEAYEVLGLKPGATDSEIRAAHRRLMRGVHPDQGGSTFLASKINSAKDRLLRKTRR